MILYCTSEFASVMVSYLLPPYMARIDGWARGPCSLDASLDDIAQKRWHRVSSGSCGCILAKLGYQTVCRLTTPPSKKKKIAVSFFFVAKINYASENGHFLPKCSASGPKQMRVSELICHSKVIFWKFQGENRSHFRPIFSNGHHSAPCIWELHQPPFSHLKFKKRLLGAFE